MHSIKDDPGRTAPPFCAPGEVEPGEIAESEAVETIMSAIWRDGFAYGRHCLALVDDLIDSLGQHITDELLNADPHQLKCHLHANIDNPNLRARCVELANGACYA